MKSRFWQYFHDKLNWPAIFSPGPLSALAKGLALHMDSVREDILWLRDQWSPVTADPELVARYGASRGILRTRFDTDESYRLRVINAFAWHKLGGKVRGLVQILAENGFSGAVILPVNDVRRHDGSLSHNGKATYNAGKCWAHFDVRLDIPETGLDAEIMAWFRWLVNEYKPARSVLRALSWQMPLADATDVADDMTLAVAPEYVEVRKWGFPLHDGTIRYNNGIRRFHNGQFRHNDGITYASWMPRAGGHCHNGGRERLDVAIQPAMADHVSYTPLHNGSLRYDGLGRHGSMAAPFEALAVSTASRIVEPVPVSDSSSQQISPAIQENIGLYHDGSITHGQRYKSRYNAKFYHDGSRPHGSFGGNPDFCTLRHDGRGRHNATARHKPWGWLETAGKNAPLFTYGAFADGLKATGTMQCADDFGLSDSISLVAWQYGLHDDRITHNGEARYGGKRITI